MAQNIIFYIKDFESNNDINFNYRIYKRDPSKSYRPGEAQTVPYNLKLFPNSPPVDSDHILIEENLDISSPHTIPLEEDESYYIMVWKDGYIHENKNFYVAINDGINTGNFPGNIIFNLRRLSSNASLFV